VRSNHVRLDLGLGILLHSELVSLLKQLLLLCLCQLLRIQSCHAASSVAAAELATKARHPLHDPLAQAPLAGSPGLPMRAKSTH